MSLLARLAAVTLLLVVACYTPPVGVPSIPIPIPLRLVENDGILTITAEPGTVEPGRRVEFFNYNLGIGVIERVESDGSFVIEIAGTLGPPGDFLQFSHSSIDGLDRTGGNCFEAKESITSDDYFDCPAE